MLRKIAALTACALAGALLVMPDPSSARAGGMRGGFPGAKGPGFSPHHPRIPGLPLHAKPIQFRHPVLPRISPLLARTTVRAPFAHLPRRSHGAYVYGSDYPVTGNDEAAYFGLPYDPGASIPVYGPAPLIQEMDSPPPRPPRLSSTRDENAEACRSERVTVPAGEGEREITVVRC
ncbi:MAG: hypothetical protein E6G97_00740 [Alphaproteobacteria bacterium]|nr:MAG: hypothetical protein E6G97_00740 [Alphaproteobacteria bacterium]